MPRLRNLRPKQRPGDSPVPIHFQMDVGQPWPAAAPRREKAHRPRSTRVAAEADSDQGVGRRRRPAGRPAALTPNHTSEKDQKPPASRA